MSDDLKKRAESAIYLLRNGGDDDPVLEDVGLESEGPYSLDMWMADCHVATIHPNEGQTDFALAECIRDSGKLIKDLVDALDAALAELADLKEVHAAACAMELVAIGAMEQATRERDAAPAR